MSKTQKFFRSYPKFKDSKYPDASEDEEPNPKESKEISQDPEAAKKDGIKKTPWIDDDDEDFKDLDFFGQPRSPEELQVDGGRPSFQDTFRTHLMDTIDREIRIADGEEVEEDEGVKVIGPESDTVEEDVRYGITEKQVFDKLEELMTKCKCRDCEIERRDYDRVLEAAEDEVAEGFLSERDKRLFNALHSEKERDFFRRQHEKTQMKNLREDLKWFPEINFDDDCEKCRVNIDDYKKKTDSDDEDPFINLARKFDEVDMTCPDECYKNP